jgi:hypothetical protein
LAIPQPKATGRCWDRRARAVERQELLAQAELLDVHVAEAALVLDHVLEHVADGLEDLLLEAVAVVGRGSPENVADEYGSSGTSTTLLRQEARRSVVS